MNSYYTFPPTSASPKLPTDYFYPLPGSQVFYSPNFGLPAGLEHRFPSPAFNRLNTPIDSLASLASSPNLPSLTSSPSSINSRGKFSDFIVDPLLKRRYSDVESVEDDTLVIEPHLNHNNKRICSRQLSTNSETPRISLQHATAPPPPMPEFSQLQMLSYISTRTSNATPSFLQSDLTYTVFQPISPTHISDLLDNSYGGRVIVSRKRKPLQTDFESHVTVPAAKKSKRAQGRPYSSEMVIDLILPKTVDELYEYLCVKGAPPTAHRVRLQSNDIFGAGFSGSSNGSTGRSQQPAKDKQGNPIFSNTQSMMEYFTGSKEFSIITAFRQSSMDKSAFKKGTCPVVKFNISPVTDYSVEYLKRMAYPRYKACMKIYFVPQVFAEAAHTFYTSAAMYLQDQETRLANGLPVDTKSRIFHSSSWPDLPHSVYDRQFRVGETKTKLNYILN